MLHLHNETIQVEITLLGFCLIDFKIYTIVMIVMHFGTHNFNVS